jgi:hypothetical protein
MGMENAAPPSDIAATAVGALIPAAMPDDSARALAGRGAARESLKRFWDATRVGAQETRYQGLAAILRGGLPLVAVVGSASLVVIGRRSADLGVVDLAALGVILLAGLRQTFLVHERGRLLNDSGRARAELEEALVQ